MAVCDICGKPGIGTLISAENMRQAVFKKGFNPVSLGLVSDPIALANRSEWYKGWKNTIVAQDTSDWNICPHCMAKLKSYLIGTPKPTGATRSTVSTDPLASTLAGAATEQKYTEENTEGSEKSKRSSAELLVISGLLVFIGGLLLVVSIAFIVLNPALFKVDPGMVLLMGSIFTLPILVIGFLILRSGFSRPHS